MAAHISTWPKVFECVKLGFFEETWFFALKIYGHLLILLFRVSAVFVCSAPGNLKKSEVSGVSTNAFLKNLRKNIDSKRIWVFSIARETEKNISIP